MKGANTYRCLSTSCFSTGVFKIIPLRDDDKFLIMKWRNEQIYHLRQTRPLTETDQISYFENTVAKLFEQTHPEQILFSFLKNEECVGYGGLVHINWNNRHAEISFLMDTELELTQFEENWTAFLSLIKRVAFVELSLHKLFTYAYDLRPHLYPVLESAGFNLEARLKEHCFFNGVYVDVVIHSTFKEVSTLSLI